MDNTELIRILIDKQDSLIKEFTEVKVILARQEINLALHMKRSDELEKYVSMLENDVKPIKRGMAMAEGVFKVLGALATIATIVIGAFKIYAVLTGHT